VDDHSGADDLQLPVILPGFIDLHVHGAAGVDLMQGGDVARTIARTICASAPPRCWRPP
jgi:N-acetylglucosamine-6-phosphate deacetylase